MSQLHCKLLIWMLSFVLRLMMTANFVSTLSCYDCLNCEDSATGAAECADTDTMTCVYGAGYFVNGTRAFLRKCYPTQYDDGKAKCDTKPSMDYGQVTYYNISYCKCTDNLCNGKKLEEITTKVTTEVTTKVTTAVTPETETTSPKKCACDVLAPTATSTLAFLFLTVLLIL
ncbi:hypothetical protein HELRODRAFT_173284 [Helobdella robusta]|uniref:UPAR/Ly6 domain-containing protein n=1 Tax=Helobdella robusta TaxID=6412 RepID=T1F6M9_HELRO|nr:hypothetical protein HELRODRAFT_173284 [Helobdella robusta]ESO03580.1 hypothetical protein HELRODRAFT_173284 [Helobdella robusta]